MDRVFSSLTIRTVSEDERIIEGIASTPRTDRQSDIVESLGAAYELPIPFLLDHDHLSAVGEVEMALVTATGIKFRARIKKIAEPGPVKDLCDKAWALLKSGLRKFVSIGFRPLDAEPMANGGLRFLSWEWLELSACAVPANPDARITGLKAAGHTVVKLPPPTLHDIAKDFLPQFRNLSEKDKRIVRAMRAQFLRRLDGEIARLNRGLSPTPRPPVRVGAGARAARQTRVVRL